MNCEPKGFPAAIGEINAAQQQPEKAKETHMLRNLVTAFALAIFTQAAFGLGLGSLQKSSALNEPFSARIDILSATATDFDTLTVKLADSDQFERAGVLREALLLELKFKIIQARNGSDYIQITSHQPIKEPYLNFLIELNWANGRMIREYTVLLDPPLYDPVRKPQVAKTAPAPQPPPTPSPVVDEPLPSARPSPPSSPPPTVDYTPSTYSGGETIGPVAANDTLWRLADAHRPADVSVQQMMMALFLANQDAFGNNNINFLKRGAVLRMPSREQLDSLSHREAVAQAQQHHQAWNNYRQGAAESVAEQPLGSDDLVADSGDDSALLDDDAFDESDARLELAAPEDGDGSGVGGDSGAEATLIQEQLDAKAQENAELMAKLAEADEIIELMQRQVEIKDEELAALQARLQQLGVETADALGEQTELDEIVDTDAEMPAEVSGDEEGVEELFEEAEESIAEVEEATEEPADEMVEEEVGEQEPEVTEEEPVAEQEIAADPTPQESQPGGVMGFLSQLVPAHIAEMVPGGVMTILGAIGALLLLIFGGIIKWLMGGREREMPTPSHEKAKADDATAADDLDETIADADPDTTVSDLETDTIEANAEEVSESFEDTLEATSDDLAPVAPEAEAEEPEDDPLAEVNVYLAYERFDQAEELVRKVIAEHPDVPKYRLQLLEVFYSANDQASYEGEARNLLDAVGEDDPMWQSALAMWAEISPDRALFAEGGVDPSAADTGSMKAFVDITSETEDGGLTDITGGADTVSMAPDARDELESTAVGLANEDEVGPVDFNLSEDDSSIDADGTVDLNLATTSDADLLDLTAAEPAEADVAETADLLDLEGSDADDGAVLDLTAADEGSNDVEFDLADTTESTGDDIFDLTETAEADEVLDLTATSDGTASADDDVFDLTAAADEELGDATGDDIFDLTEISDDDAAGEGAGEGELSLADDDLLDLTTPSEASEADLLDVTRTGDISAADTDELLNVTAPGTLDAADGAEAEEDTVDFDISETVADVFSDTSGGEGAADELLDITGNDSEEALDFEIGSLDDADGADESDAEHQTVKLGAADDDDLASDDTVDFDLSLQSTELDELTETTDDAPEEDGAIDFDLALEDTSDMDSIVVDETLELPKSSADDESLEDLTKSMEDSMAELELDMDSSDSDLNASLDEEMDIDLDLGDETIGIEAGSEIEDGDLEDVESTVIMTDDDGAGDPTETDTKLNLAKAYIELGDNDGARSILDEVARDGTDEQKTEAQRLIDQIS